jgi:hypothetical protein
MKRYEIDVKEASDGPDIDIIEYRFGDWVKFEDANDEIYLLKTKLAKLEQVINDAYDILYRGL